MKAINSNIWKCILFAALGFTALASCSEDAMDRVNEDNDHTTSAPAKFVLADVITSTAFSNVGGDLNTYFSVYTEHTVGVDNQLYNAEIRNGEPSGVHLQQRLGEPILHAEERTHCDTYGVGRSSG